MNTFRKAAYHCNPYLPSKEHIPDGEPHVYGDRIYIYGSHDEVGTDCYCAGSYVGWSCPVDDLSDWKYEGEIYKKGQDPLDPNGDKEYYAPDCVQGPDGKFYLYYSMFQSYVISVAVADQPMGPFCFYGYVQDETGHILGSSDGDDYQFDPAVLADTDGRYYLYSGQDIPIPVLDGRKVKGSMVAELKEDMLTIIGSQKVLTSRNENTFTENPFFEASSIRKNGSTYYFIYSPLPNIHYLCYATSCYPDRDFRYQGILVSNADIFEENGSCSQPINSWGNNHGSVLFLEDEAYIFYHRNSGKGSFARQGCVECLRKAENGSLLQAQMTSFGIKGKADFRGTFESYIACGLHRKEMPAFQPFVFFEHLEADPYLMETEDQDYAYITNMNDGGQAVYKYFCVSGKEKKMSVCARTKAEGYLRILQDQKEIGRIRITPTEQFDMFEGELQAEQGISVITLECKECKALELLRFTVE